MNFYSAATRQHATRVSKVMEIGAVGSPALLTGCGNSRYTALTTTTPLPPTPVATIPGLNTLKNLVWAFNPINGDANPYGLAITPARYDGLDSRNNIAALPPGDLIINDFIDKAGANVDTSLLPYAPSTHGIAH